MRLGKMTPAGLELSHNRSVDKGYTSADRNVQLPQELEEIIKANDAAWLFLSNLSPSYRRDSIWLVMSAKKQETRPKRLGILIVSSEARLKIPSIHEKPSYPPMRALKADILTYAIARY